MDFFPLIIVTIVGMSIVRGKDMFTTSQHALNKFSSGEPVRTNKNSADLITTAVKKLSNVNSQERLAARTTLVRIGDKAVPILIEALNDKNETLRWEAAKALGEIRDPSAANALVETLTDKSFDVRWVAAESLISIGEAGIPALLEALVHKPASVMFYKQAHHILHALSRDPMPIEVRKILQALEKPAAKIHVPVTAYAALEFLRSRKKKHVDFKINRAAQ